MTMAISTTPSLWPLSSTHLAALAMVPILRSEIRDDELLQRRLLPRGTRLMTTLFSPQKSNGLRFHCTATACVVSSAAVYWDATQCSLVGALRDIPKNGCEGDNGVCSLYILFSSKGT